MQHKRLEHIPTVTFRHVAKLHQMNIDTTQELLAASVTFAQRQALARELEVSEAVVYDWVCSIDLFRISGLSSTYVALLLAAGVNSAEKLAAQDSAELHAALSTLNNDSRIVRRLPNKKQIARWIAAAAQLPSIVEPSPGAV